jgi:hypothetical protein
MTSPLLHSQGTVILFGGVSLARFTKFTSSRAVGKKVFTPLDSTIENGVVVPVVEPTGIEHSVTMEGLAVSLPADGVVGSTKSLSITNPSWSEPVGLCLLEKCDIEGAVGAYLRLAFTFTRTAA